MACTAVHDGNIMESQPLTFTENITSKGHKLTTLCVIQGHRSQTNHNLVDGIVVQEMDG